MKLLIKSKKILVVIAVLSAGFSGCSRAVEKAETEHLSPAAVTASVDRTEINIGDKIRYVITVEYNPGLSIKFPEFGENLAGFAIKDFGRIEERKKEKRLVQEQWYLLDTYVTGSYTIPAPEVKYTAADGIEETIKGQELTVEVKSLIPQEGQEDDIRDIKPPLKLPVNYAKIIRTAVIGLIVIAVSVLLFIFIRQHEKRRTELPRLRPAHEIAYEQLEALRRMDLIAGGMIEEYYVRLSDITRHYLENRFGLRAPEMTSEEFLQAAADSPDLNNDQRRLLKDFLAHCDLVKFARYGPNRNEMEKAFTAAKQLVDETKEPGPDEDMSCGSEAVSEGVNSEEEQA